MTVRILNGDCRQLLQAIPDCSVDCCVTSPPYFGLRDYGVDGQIGLEASPQAFVDELVTVFREVRRVLRDDGTLWLNLGDSYAGSWGNYGGANRGKGKQREIANGSLIKDQADRNGLYLPPTAKVEGLKPKDLIGIPWRVAFALQADGWYLRQDLIWSKPNPMPESVRDRCTKAHEYLFLLSKSERYHFDAKAIAEPVTPSTVARLSQATLEGQAGSNRVPGKTNGTMKASAPRFGGSKYGDAEGEEHRTKSGNAYDLKDGMRNRRSVWTVATQPFTDAHFATFPPDLIEPCIKAGCPIGGCVLDPFGGAGTTGLVADRLNRNAILIELNPDYAEMARRRIEVDAPLLAEVGT
jgi:DNA modification methylase